jgi:NAD(P)-dependent dehydrogenase (short-subunit alcohol dehydrogenase family)
MRNVFILGGRGAIGLAIAARFEEDGDVVIAPGHADLDLADRASISSYLSTLQVTPDVFVHCAAINRPARFEDTGDVLLQETMQVNVLGSLQVLRHFTPGMYARRSGKVVLVSSIYGHISRRGRLAYAASKHALNGITRTLALEMGEHGVLVNAVSPGFVETPLTRRNNSAEVIQGLVGKIPLGRLADPADIAEVVAFLSSERNRYINGQSIIADGGYSIGGFEQ